MEYADDVEEFVSNDDMAEWFDQLAEYYSQEAIVAG